MPRDRHGFIQSATPPGEWSVTGIFLENSFDSVTSLDETCSTPLSSARGLSRATRVHFWLEGAMTRTARNLDRS
jgi:hypothetical protein